MMGGSILPCECVVGHGLDEDCCSATYVVYVWSFYAFCNILSDYLLLVVAATVTKRKGCWRSSFVAERNTLCRCQTAGPKILGCSYLLVAELDASTFPLLLAGFSCCSTLKMLGRCKCVGNYRRQSRSIYSLLRPLTSNLSQYSHQAHHTGTRESTVVSQQNS
jgi:hypothetical protein